MRPRPRLRSRARAVVSAVGHDGGMVRNGRQQSVKVARRPELRLPDLTAWEGPELEPDGDYDGLEFADLDLAGQEGAGARFMDCAVRRCALDEAGLGRQNGGP
ncbi:hypothetical protein ADK93_04640, partial [Streptomyces sp. XY58]